MKQVSFVQTQIGFEATADALLKKMQKRQRFAHNIQVLKVGNQYELDIIGLNILKGIPTETKEDILESSNNLKFLRFLLGNYRLTPILLVLYKRSPFYNEMSEEDRKLWKEDVWWAEIASAGIISEADRFEFSGFYRDTLDHYLVWRDFEDLLAFYAQQNCSYEWNECVDGSFIVENALRPSKYVLNRDETDLLIYCDSVRTFSEVQKRFSHVSEDNLYEIMDTLKDGGLLYYDKDVRTIISVLEAAKRNVTKNHSIKEVLYQAGAE
jgi:radical SAM superfamily enzyme YgiQ (UPF0313 family)